MLKSQGPENWPRGRPGLLWARTNSRSVRGESCGKTREGKTGRRRVASCDAADPPPRAPTNGRPGFPHPGAGGRLPMARRGQVSWRFFVPLGGACPPSGARSRRRPLECAIHHHHRHVTPQVRGTCGILLHPPPCARGPGASAPTAGQGLCVWVFAGACQGTAWAGLCLIHHHHQLVVFFSFVNGGEGAAVTVQKGSVSFGQKRPRSRGEPSPLAGLCLPSAPGADQQLGGSEGSCSVCSAAARGGAAVPGSRIDNHRCRLGWEGAAKSGGRGAGFLFRRFAGAASADAMSSFGWGRRSPRAISTSSFGNSGGRRWPCREQLMFLLECFCEWNDTPGRGLVFS